MRDANLVGKQLLTFILISLFIPERHIITLQFMQTNYGYVPFLPNMRLHFPDTQYVFAESARRLTPAVEIAQRKFASP